VTWSLLRQPWSRRRKVLYGTRPRSLASATGGCGIGGSITKNSVMTRHLTCGRENPAPNEYPLRKRIKCWGRVGKVFRFDVRHFHEKLGAVHGMKLSYDCFSRRCSLPVFPIDYRVALAKGVFEFGGSLEVLPLPNSPDSPVAAKIIIKGSITIL
jgi:hypothetical protein